MIKSNIDLTENEMFSKPRIKKISFANLFRAIGMTFPWEIHFNDYDLSPELQLILTGNKEERKLKQLYLEESSKKYCDCCGTYLLTIPWDRIYGLCRKCQYNMEINYSNKKKYPWEQQHSQEIVETNPLYW